MKIVATQQKGAVMITVLILLVVITLMGLGLMKQGMFQANMGLSEVAYSTCFNGAESGLNGVYRAFQAEPVPITDENNFMNQASGAPVIQCLGDDGVKFKTGSSCPAGSLSEYGDITVSMRSRPADPNDKSEKNQATFFNTDVDKGGFLLIYTDSRCEIASMDLAVVNTQAWQHRASNSLPRLQYTN